MRTPEQIAADYAEFRGRCQELCAVAMAEDPTLILVRGHYFESRWPTKPMQAHWWCKKPDGTIVDPSARQFPSNGTGQYIEFDGRIECAECGKEGREDDPEWSFESRYAFCCHRCHGRFVGVY